MSRNDEGTTCILLTPPIGELPQRLKNEVNQRAWQLVQVSDALEAFAQTCLLERVAASRKSWGLPRTGRIALVIVNPNDWSESSELLLAVRRYTPGIDVWAFENEVLRKLLAATDAANAANEETATPAPDGHAALADAARADDPDRQDEDREDAPAEPPLDTSRITTDEITMLLARPGDKGANS